MFCHGLICVVLLIGSIAKVSLWFFLIFPLSLLLIYCLVAVWSLYRKLKPKNKQHTSVPLNDPNHDTSIPIPGSAQRVPYPQETPNSPPYPTMNYPQATPNSPPYPTMNYPQANSPPYPTAPVLPYPVMPQTGHPQAPVYDTPNGWK